MPAAKSSPAPLSPPVAEIAATDPWTRRARPGFLYVIYLLLLSAVPLGLVAAFSPPVAQAMTRAMTTYLRGLPEPLYALFGTCYLGYTAARQWGKSQGVDR